jgi:phosphoenolpyruvate phosphomutase
MNKSDIVYVAMAADIIHLGHINIIETADTLGPVVIGLLTDEAIRSYKREPIITWEQRRKVISSVKGVSIVIPQTTHDYVPNLETLRPAYVVHGSDWKSGTQSQVRQRVLDTLSKWGGELVEPEYTGGISTTQIIEKCKQ